MKARLLLSFAVSSFCLGWGLWLLNRLGSHTGAWLLFFHNVPHSPIGLGERTAGWILIFLAIAAWIPRWGTLVGLAGLLAAFDALIGTLIEGYAFAELTLPAHGLRIAAPLTLALWLGFPASGGGKFLRAGSTILRLGTASVFAAHGLEAFMGHPGFQDFLIATFASLGRLTLTETHVQPLLWGIGMMDLTIALAILSRRLRPLLLFAAFWGLVTAFARVTSYGWSAYPEVLLRMPHVVAPLILWMMPAQLPLCVWRPLLCVLPSRLLAKASRSGKNSPS